MHLMDVISFLSYLQLSFIEHLLYASNLYKSTFYIRTESSH